MGIVPTPMQPAQDPCPTCNGIFLTRSAASWYYCTAGRVLDADVDGVDDSCEFDVAQAFAPQLYISPNDGDPRRQTYWVARLFPGLGQSLEIMYLLGYYNDTGTLGHEGDSEWISLVVNWDAEAERWMFVSMTLSAHWGTGNNQTGTYYAYEVWYPAQNGTPLNWGQSRKYPLVWASKGKHANYRDQGECNWWQSGDTCSDNVPADRVEVIRERNLGATTHRLVDCTYSSVYAGVECFWTGSVFRGWQLQGGDTPYKDILSAYGWMVSP